MVTSFAFYLQSVGQAQKDSVIKSMQLDLHSPKSQQTSSQGTSKLKSLNVRANNASLHHNTQQIKAEPVHPLTFAAFVSLTND